MFLNYKYQNKNKGKIFEKAITTGGRYLNNFIVKNIICYTVCIIQVNIF